MPKRAITPREDTILRVLLRYHYLTARQVCRLLRFSPNSIEHVQTLLRGLWRDGYLKVEELPRPAALAPQQRRGGAGAYVYQLTRQADQYLASVGCDIPPRRRLYIDHSPLHLTHTVEASELLLAAELLTDVYPRVTIRTFLHERDLHHRASKVTITDPATGERKQVGYTPDGYVDFIVKDPFIARDPKGYEAPVIFEVDRATENQTKWRQRVRAMVAYHHGPHHDAFGLDVLTVAVIASTGTKRLQDLSGWTFTELADMRASDDDKDLFRFATFDIGVATPDAKRPTPADIFLAPRWYAFLYERPVPLLHGVE